MIRRAYPVAFDANGQLVADGGVDFGFCNQALVIAVGDGEVITVLDDKAHESDIDYRGTVVTILHELPGPDHQVVVFNYFNVGKVLVRRRDRVHRGQVIAEPYVSPDGGWIPQLHLLMLDSHIPSIGRDALKLIKSCESRATQDELIYPVPC